MSLWCATSLSGVSWRVYFKASSACSSRTHLRTVLRDSPVNFSRSCKGFLPRICSCWILPKISMVIAFLLLPKNQEETVNTGGQFSVNADKVGQLFMCSIPIE